MKGQTLQVTLQPRGTISSVLVLKNWDLWRTAAYKQFPVTSVFLAFEYAACVMWFWALGQFWYESQSQEYLQSISPSCYEIWSFYFADVSSLRMWGVSWQTCYTRLPEFVRSGFSIRKMFPVQSKLLIFLPLSCLGLKTEDVQLVKKGKNNYQYFMQSFDQNSFIVLLFW